MAPNPRPAPRPGPHPDDPRASPAALEDVPRLVAEGAERYNAGRFWHAHEAWEEAWHGLRAAGRQEEADFLQALVLVTACFENLRRGKPLGFRRQLDKALRWMGALPGRGAALGLADEAGFLAGLEAVRRASEGREVRGLADLEALGLAAPPLELRPP